LELIFSFEVGFCVNKYYTNHQPRMKGSKQSSLKESWQLILIEPLKYEIPDTKINSKNVSLPSGSQAQLRRAASHLCVDAFI